MRSTVIVGVIGLCVLSGMAFAKQANNPLDRNPAKPNPLDRAPATLRLKLHEFRDVTMGIVSYTATLPEGWKSVGQTEWSQGELSFPQTRIDLLSPSGGRVRTFPMVNMMYTEMNPVPGFDPIPPQGTPAPDDFPRWLMQKVEADPKFSDMKLIESHRDAKLEGWIDDADRKLGANTQGQQREVQVMTYEYLEDGQRRREYDVMVYTRFAPMINQNLRSQTWSFYPMTMLSAPVEEFDKALPMLRQAQLSLNPTPQWSLASQALIGELSRQRIQNSWERIRQRGQQLDKISDDDYRRYKQSTHSSNVAQHDRINSIYETEDFRDTSGQIVNLPIHYQHVFSDGQGNFVLSNNSQDKPGERWNEIDRMK